MSNRLNKLQRRFQSAQADGDYKLAARLARQIEDYGKPQVTRQHTSIAECVGDDSELQSRICEKLIEMLIAGDLLYSRIMEFEAVLPDDVAYTPIARQARQLRHAAHDFVEHIDLFDNPGLSESYAEVVEEVEQKLLHVMANVITNTLRQRIDIT